MGPWRHCQELSTREQDAGRYLSTWHAALMGARRPHTAGYKVTIVFDQRSCLLAYFFMDVMLQHLVTFIVLATEFPQSAQREQSEIVTAVQTIYLAFASQGG